MMHPQPQWGIGQGCLGVPGDTPYESLTCFSPVANSWKVKQDFAVWRGSFCHPGGRGSRTGSGMGREQSVECQELLQLILPSHCWEHLGKGMHSTYQNFGDGFQHFGLSAKTGVNHSGPGAVVTEAVEGGGKGGASTSGGLSSSPPLHPLFGALVTSSQAFTGSNSLIKPALECCCALTLWGPCGP